MVLRESLLSRISRSADAVERFFSSPTVSAVTFWIILLYGASLRLVYRLMSNGKILRDEYTYLKRIAVAAEAGLQNSTSPNFLIFLGTVFYRNPEQTELLLRGINFAASLALIVVAYFLGREVFNGRWAGLVTMLFAAITPDLVRFGCSMMREPLYLLIFALLLLQCVLYWKSPSCVRALFCCLLSLMGLWARYEGAELFFFLPLTLFTGVLLRRFPLRTALTGLAVFLSGSFLFILLFLLLLPVYYQKVWLKFTTHLPG